MAENQEAQVVFQTESGEPIDPASLGLDPDQLAALLSGTSSDTQFVDEEGNPISAEVIQLQEGDAPVNEDTQMVYVLAAEQEAMEVDTPVQPNEVSVEEVEVQSSGKTEQPRDVEKPIVAQAYKCAECPRKFASATALDRHTEIIHKKKADMFAVADSTRPVPKMVSYFCSDCNKSMDFESRSHFDAHKRMVHTDAPAVSDAVIVEEKKAQEVSLSLDTPATGTDSPMMFQCGTCEAGYSTTVELLQHIQDEHVQGGGPKLLQQVEEPPPVEDRPAPPINRCRVCSKEFISAVGLKKHSAEHLSKDTSKASLSLPLKRIDAPDFKPRSNSDSKLIAQCALLWQTAAEKPAESEAKADAASPLKQQPETRRSRRPSVKGDLSEGPVGEKHECARCSRRFGTTAGLEAHLRTMHPEPEVIPEATVASSSQVDVDARRSKAQAEVDEILKSITSFRCCLCLYKGASAHALFEHFETTHSTGSATGHHRCVDCNRVFGTLRSFTAHQRKHASLVKQQECPICFRKFGEKENLARHLRTHKDKVFPCTECDKKFTNKKLLDRHLLVHTGSTEHKCRVCSKVFTRAENLKAHFYLHSGEKPHECQTCHSRFSSRWLLNNHMTDVHSTAKPYMCETCGRTFSLRSNLQLHERAAHRRMKPFECSACHRQFSRLDHLQTHANAHKGIRSHPCTLCDAAFNSATQLNQHMHVHASDDSEQTPFQCGTCGQNFGSRPQLVKHVRKHTGEDAPSGADEAYIVLWEKAGSIHEAVVANEQLAGEADIARTLIKSPRIDRHEHNLRIAPTPIRPSTSSQQPALVDEQYMMAQNTPQTVPGLQSLLETQDVQFVDEHGNPIEGLTGEEQYVLLQQHEETNALLQQPEQGAVQEQVVEQPHQAVAIDRETLLSLTNGAPINVGTLTDDGQSVVLTEAELQQLATEHGIQISYQD